MTSFWFHQHETEISIPTFEEINNVIYYKIVVRVGEITWELSHRYSEFHELHNQLIADHGVAKDILPSKKVIWNKCPIFLENRRKGLEDYCHKILNYFNLTMPRVFLEFFDFHVFDNFFLLQNLAMRYFIEGDALLEAKDRHLLTPLELHALTECLQKPPTVENSDSRYDFTHILDFYSQLHSLVINGSDSCYLSSNIVPNNLGFELKSFKELTSLLLNNVALDKISSVGSLRSTLQYLYVHNTTMTSISNILQCDVFHKHNLEPSLKWTKLTVMNLSNNNIVEIDETITLVPNLKVLIINSNKINQIDHLSHLHNLSHLSLSNNQLTVCDQLHTKIGNILTLNLSQNKVTSLEGFKKMYSLVTLDLSCNKIVDIDEISFIGDLPCLENLILTGNCIAFTVDYRIKVLEHFNDRAKDICLDNEKPTQNELDKVYVLRALRIVKEGKTPDLSTNYT